MYTCYEVASNLPQGCVPQNYTILLFAYLLRLPYLAAVHSALSLNSGIVTLIKMYKKDKQEFALVHSMESLYPQFSRLNWNLEVLVSMERTQGKTLRTRK